MTHTERVESILILALGLHLPSVSVVFAKSSQMAAKKCNTFIKLGKTKAEPSNKTDNEEGKIEEEDIEN